MTFEITRRSVSPEAPRVPPARDLHPAQAHLRGGIGGKGQQSFLHKVSLPTIGAGMALSFAVMIGLNWSYFGEAHGACPMILPQHERAANMIFMAHVIAIIALLFWLVLFDGLSLVRRVLRSEASRIAVLLLLIAAAVMTSPFVLPTFPESVLCETLSLRGAR